MAKRTSRKKKKGMTIKKVEPKFRILSEVHHEDEGDRDFTAKNVFRVGLESVPHSSVKTVDVPRFVERSARPGSFREESQREVSPSQTAPTTRLYDVGKSLSGSGGEARTYSTSDGIKTDKIAESSLRRSVQSHAMGGSGLMEDRMIRQTRDRLMQDSSNEKPYAAGGVSSGSKGKERRRYPWEV